ncbi:hypothetical protein BFJ72_g14803 [Fusarium proliferatum]|uniref:Uncharacterized protein n=1 Tax=Gibberella intermedia TaxID=948311 RepID=A0A420RY44_GIBIN|nr:hypothetical protein BFJ72_g14803 [Fusarium proliferatum]
MRAAGPFLAAARAAGPGHASMAMPRTCGTAGHLCLRIHPSACARRPLLRGRPAPCARGTLRRGARMLASLVRDPAAHVLGPPRGDPGRQLHGRREAAAVDAAPQGRLRDGHEHQHLAFAQKPRLGQHGRTFGWGRNTLAHTVDVPWTVWRSTSSWPRSADASGHRGERRQTIRRRAGARKRIRKQLQGWRVEEIQLSPPEVTAENTGACGLPEPYRACAKRHRVPGRGATS